MMDLLEFLGGAIFLTALVFAAMYGWQLGDQPNPKKIHEEHLSNLRDLGLTEEQIAWLIADAKARHEQEREQED